MILQSTADGLKAVIQEVLDYLHKNVTASIVYEDFHDFSKGIKGAEVDYFPETADEILLEIGQPLEVKEQVREEFQQQIDVMNEIIERQSKNINDESVTIKDIVGLLHFEMTFADPSYLDKLDKLIDKVYGLPKSNTPKASNPELGVEEAVNNFWNYGYSDSDLSTSDRVFDGLEFEVVDKIFRAGANWQATQQQGLVNLDEVEQLIKEI